MDLLYANDRNGNYPQSWYAATTPTLPPFAPLSGDVQADVCVIGGGYTGLSAALHLAEAGRRVVLLEAQRVGFGASGRNGGQLGSGQRPYQTQLEAWVGAANAKHLWDFGEEAKGLVRRLIAKHGIACHLRPGIVWTGSSIGDVDALHRYADLLREKYAYDKVEPLDGPALHTLCPSPDYKGGALDTGGAHLHPLAFALGLARAAASSGAQLCEGSRVVSVEPGKRVRVKTQQGKVFADHVILGCNGYLSGFAPQVTARVMPINNFMVATEPLGSEADRVLSRDIAVADSWFVVNYFRLSHDKRLLFGGGESYGYRFPRDIASVVRKPMTRIFPHLKDIEIDYAWGGTLGITMKRFPYVARLSSNVLNASGYSGHGVGTATHAGFLMARAVQGDDEGFDTMGLIPAPAFPGGGRLRTPLLALAMTWYALRDRVGL
ncbi:MAG: FAD-binding oxidoreductase [Pseudomonadota bacterium]